MPDVQPATPQIITMGCRNTGRGEQWEWHTHPYDELCLVAEDSTSIGHAGRRTRVEPNTLFLHRRGEPHGFWNKPEESPDLWIIHFAVSDSFFANLPDLVVNDSSRRVWRMGQAEMREFRGLFVNMTLEAARPTPDASVLSSAWLQLLLGAMQRWHRPNESKSLVIHDADVELLDLWKTINDMVSVPFAEMDRLPELVDNYDSLRHRFRRVFGLSPRAMMLALRMQRAQHLLLEGQKSVKEVASLVGYYRQHEFARAFRKAFGVSPREWRTRPRVNVDRERLSN
jgi:hypothetical protein